MENQGPQLLVAQFLVRESQQRLPKRQREEPRRERDAVAGPRPARPNRFRLAIASALVFVGQHLAGISGGNPGAT